MEKLVLVHFWGDEGCSGTAFVPFEYESKDAFVFDVLEKYKDREFASYGPMSTGEEVEIIPNVYMCKSQIEDIERSIFTLEEWFEREKETVII